MTINYGALKLVKFVVGTLFIAHWMAASTWSRSLNVRSTGSPTTTLASACTTTGRQRRARHRPLST